MNIEISRIKTEDELAICSKLREEFFGNEENAPEELYIIDPDDRNENTKNYLLKVDGIPVATVRFIRINDKTVKLQRLVVLKKYRNKGYARLILSYLEKDVFELGYKKIIMDSALKAVGFYENNGYKIKSDVFYEDGRPHVKMEKEL